MLHMIHIITYTEYDASRFLHFCMSVRSIWLANTRRRERALRNICPRVLAVEEEGEVWIGVQELYDWCE